MEANMWAELKKAYNNGWLSGMPFIGNNAWYVDPQVGASPAAATSWSTAAATMADLNSKLENGDTIFFRGVLKEQWVTPQDVFDVTIIGVANRPRQATDGGVATGGGASWLAPASPTATTPLLKIREQGWKVANVQFAPVANSACIRFSRAETAADMDGSHGTVLGCYFSAGGSGGIGIEDVGGCSRVRIEGCRFEGLAAAIKGISTGIAVPLMWEIVGNVFKGNTSDVLMSLSYSRVEGNRFHTAGSGATNKVVSTVAVSGQGGYNLVADNHFHNTQATIQISNGFSGASTDYWRNNSNNTAAQTVGVPGA